MHIMPAPVFVVYGRTFLIPLAISASVQGRSPPRCLASPDVQTEDGAVDGSGGDLGEGPGTDNALVADAAAQVSW
jgi:hypothetical protein